MDSPETTRKLVMKYYNSWQKPTDYKEMRSCLTDDLIFDAGMQTLEGGDTLVEFVKKTELPWKVVNMLGSIFEKDKAAIMYEGIDETSGIRTRVAEYINLKNERISKITAVVCALTAIEFGLSKVK